MVAGIDPAATVAAMKLRTSRPRRWSLAAALCSLAVVASACQYQGNQSGPKVDVVGDSITWLATPDISGALAPHYAYLVSGKVGYTIAQQQPTINFLLANNSGAPADVIVNLGTNDAMKQHQPGGYPQYQADYNNMVASLAGVHCVILVTINTLTDYPSGNTAQTINSDIAQTVATRHNFHEIDWANLISQGNNAQQWLNPTDMVHPNAAGQQEIANLYLQALQADC
jgi:hypothetical protein